MKLETALEELKDDLNNKINERVAIEKFISSLNITGLFMEVEVVLHPMFLK